MQLQQQKQNLDDLSCILQLNIDPTVVITKMLQNFKIEM